MGLCSSCKLIPPKIAFTVLVMTTQLRYVEHHFTYLYDIAIVVTEFKTELLYNYVNIFDNTLAVFIRTYVMQNDKTYHNYITL